MKMNIYAIALLLSVLFIWGCAPTMIRVPKVVTKKDGETDPRTRIHISVPPLITKHVSEYVEKVPEGDIEFLGGEQKIIARHQCKAYGTCGIKELSFTVERYRLPLEEPFYGTRAILHMKTEYPFDQNAFTVVQFIRGCKYSTAIEKGSGHIQRYIDWEMKEFEPVGAWGGYPIKIFPRADSIIILPYGSYFSYEHQYPSMTAGMAYNTVFQLRSCLYRASSVSASSGAGSFDSTEPIVCFDWDSVFVFNHTSRKFKSDFKFDMGHDACASE